MGGPRTTVCAGLVAAVLCGACGTAGPETAPVSSSTVGTSTVGTSTVGTSTVSTSSATSAAVYPAPFIDHVQWVQTTLGRSLQIYPTTSGRRTEADTAMAAAWAEVLRQAPDADTPGMRAQFDCHWNYARAAEPDKPSWNIEPWRPVVSDEEMIATRCNPGGPEE
ncbi:DUF2599 domain-containing protein [Gordonia sp. NPDC003424]